MWVKTKVARFHGQRSSCTNKVENRESHSTQLLFCSVLQLICFIFFLFFFSLFKVVAAKPLSFTM